MTDKEKSTKKIKTTTDTTKVSSKNGIFSVIALSISVFVLVAGFWQVARFDDKITNINRTTAKLSSQLTTRFEETQTLFSKLVEQEKQFKDFNETLAKYLKRIQLFENDLNSPDRHLSLREMMHGLHIAQWLLIYQKDVKSAIELLKIIETRIAGLPQFEISIRKAIAKDIAILESVSIVDEIGILTRIDALSGMIPNLSLEPKKFVIKKPSNNKSGTGLTAEVKKGWESIKRLVVLRDREKPIEPILTAENRIILDQNMQLLLKQTQWAVIQRNQLIYVKLLKQAQEWLIRYFNQQDPANLSINKSLTELQKINISPKIPNLSVSLKAVDDAISFQHSKRTTKQKHAELMSYKHIKGVA